MATLIPPQSDATDLDQESLERRLFELIQSVFPAWSEDSVLDFSNILLGLFAYVGDVLMYYLNRQGDEARFATARLRSSMLALSKLIGYKPRGATASQVDVTVTIDGTPPGGIVLIPTGTVVTSVSGGVSVDFQTLVPYQIDAGVSSTTITAENSEEMVDQFVASGIASQEIVLESTPYLDGSAIISASNGDFTEVDDFFGSTSTDRVYTVDVDEFDRARVRFGDGTNGAVPTGDIEAIYRVGGGSSGVVDAGTVTKIQGQFFDEFGTPVVLTAINPEASTPALNRESVEEIRINAPRSIRAPNRTVAREDFEQRAYDTGKIARALMLTSNDDPGIDENSGTLYLVAVGGGAPTQAVIDEVINEATVVKPKTLTFDLNVTSAPFLDVEISTVIHLAENAVPADVKAEVVANLVAYFAADLDAKRASEGRRQVDFGYYLAESLQTNESAIPLSDIHTEIDRVPGVRKIDDRPDGILVNGERADLSVGLNQFPRIDPDDIVVIDILTGPIS
jgi:hypothetical protein